MSLNFDLTQIADRDTNYPPVRDDAGEIVQMNGITYGMIWATLATDIGHIKDEATAREAHRRWVALGHDNPGEPGDLSVEHFIGHIGLRTNVFNTGKRAFAAKLKRIEAQRVADENRRVAMRAEREPATA